MKRERLRLYGETNESTEMDVEDQNRSQVFSNLCQMDIINDDVDIDYFNEKEYDVENKEEITNGKIFFNKIAIHL